MKSSRLKDLIRNQEGNASFEEYRTRYASERFLARLQRSRFVENFILKGGFLLGVQYNIDQRTTRDLDTLLHEMNANQEEIENIIQEIIQINLNDGVTFALLDLKETQEGRRYPGFRAKLQLQFEGERTVVQFDLDIGVGDVVTPDPHRVSMPLLFNESKSIQEKITLLSYPIETVLAEKTEIILSLGTLNTRMKDFYDMHLILTDVNRPSLPECYRALNNTWSKRRGNPINEELFDEWFFTLDDLQNNQTMANEWWSNYTRNRVYTTDISFVDIIVLVANYIREIKAYYLTL